MTLSLAVAAHQSTLAMKSHGSSMAPAKWGINTLVDARLCTIYVCREPSVLHVVRTTGCFGRGCFRHSSDTDRFEVPAGPLHTVKPKPRKGSIQKSVLFCSLYRSTYSVMAEIESKAVDHYPLATDSS